MSDEGTEPPEGGGDADDFGSLANVDGDAIESTAAEVVNQKEADGIRVRIGELRDQMTEGYFEMGRLLYVVSKKGLYTQWRGPNGKPYKTLADYVEHEVAFALRKAKYLMSISWWFQEELGDPTVMEKVKGLGWQKVAYLVGVIDSKNADAWVEKAKRLGIKELNDEARMAMEKANRPRRPSRESAGGGGGGGRSAASSSAPSAGGKLDAPEAEAEQERLGVDPLSSDEARDHVTRWTIMLSGEQRLNIERAIDTAAKIAEAEVDGKGYLLDFVATGFLALHGGTGGSNDEEHKVNFRNDLLRGIERVLGVDLVAFDRGTARTIFGAQTVDRVAALEEAGGAD